MIPLHERLQGCVIQMEVGNVVHQTGNDGWWWLQRKNEHGHLIGLCIKEPRSSSDHAPWIGTPSVFHHKYRDGNTIRLVPPEDVPDELLSIIAEMALTGTYEGGDYNVAR